MTNLLKISSLFIVIILNKELLGQTGLRYNEFLSLVKQSNPLAKKASNNLEYSKLQFKAAKGNFDPQLSSSTENKYYNSSDYFTLFNAEIKQPIYTSQYIKVGYQYTGGMYINPEKNTPVNGLPYIGIQASLLQGLMFDKNRAEIIKGKHYSDYYNLEEKIQLNDLLYVTSNTYFDYLYTKRNNSLYGYFLNLAEERLKGIKALAVIGERASMDTIEASIFVQGRLLDKQSGELELNKKNNELVILLQGEKDDYKKITPLDSIDLIYELTRKIIISNLLKEEIKNPILIQYQAKQKVLEAEAKLKREMIKPVLDVNYNFLNNSYTGSFPNINTNNYKWGATFSVPLFIRKSYNEYKIANLMIENNELELINKENQIINKRKFIIEAIKIITEQISNAEKSASYNKLLVEAEKLKFNNGESSLFLLNSRENKWLESELKLTDYKFKYIKTFLDLIYLDGNLKYELAI